MPGAAQLRALATERAAGVGFVDLELERVHPARDDVPFEEELRDVEGMDDVRTAQEQLDRPAGREDEPATIAVWRVLDVLGFDVLAFRRLRIRSQVRELPLELS